MKVLIWLILCLIWGSTWIFIKIGLEDLPPITFAAARFSLAIAILLLGRAAYLVRTRRRASGDDHGLRTSAGLDISTG